MGALPRPDLPEGPVRTLIERLHALHHAAGWPSLRVMARSIGCSHTTVSAAFSEPRVPRWGLLELVVETLGGNVAEFHALWLAATGAVDRAGAIGATAPAGPANAAIRDSGSGHPGAAQAPVATARPPRQLPAAVSGFTGRRDELAALDGLLHSTGAGRVALVVGTAGVGKTALAVHWAHRVADRFPDGQLYLDLRGYDAGRPLDAAQALESLLRALGVEGAAVPRTLADRAAAYRSLLADKSVLVLLDNAHSVEQVRDLIPGNPACFVLVTSRSSLTSVVVRHGAVRINVDLLPVDQAYALLRHLVGERVTVEAGAAARLADQCARLPLALRIAAELVAARPGTTLADLVAELDDEPGRLELLRAADDEYTAVRTVFSWSWRHLDAVASQTFRLLGLHVGREIGLPAAAALLGVDERTARASLAALERASLINEVMPGRFGMHELLRGYAAEEAARLPPATGERALARLEDHYVARAAAAMRTAYGVTWHGAHRDIEAAARLAAAATAGFPDEAAARAWLSTEWSHAVATAHAAERARLRCCARSPGFSPTTSTSAPTSTRRYGCTSTSVRPPPTSATRRRRPTPSTRWR